MARFAALLATLTLALSVSGFAPSTAVPAGSKLSITRRFARSSDGKLNIVAADKARIAHLRSQGAALASGKSVAFPHAQAEAFAKKHGADSLSGISKDAKKDKRATASVPVTNVAVCCLFASLHSLPLVC
jgi:hypothetical protein